MKIRLAGVNYLVEVILGLSMVVDDHSFKFPDACLIVEPIEKLSGFRGRDKVSRYWLVFS